MIIFEFRTDNSYQKNLEKKNGNDSSRSKVRSNTPKAFDPDLINNSLISQMGITRSQVIRLLVENDYSTTKTAGEINEIICKKSANNEHLITRQMITSYCRRNNIEVKNRYSVGTQIGDLIIIEKSIKGEWLIRVIDVNVIAGKK